MYPSSEPLILTLLSIKLEHWTIKYFRGWSIICIFSYNLSYFNFVLLPPSWKQKYFILRSIYYCCFLFMGIDFFDSCFWAFKNLPIFVLNVHIYIIIFLMKKLLNRIKLDEIRICKTLDLLLKYIKSYMRMTKILISF